MGGLFLSTPSARRATDSRRAGFTRTRISIHALREEGDVLDALRGLLQEISIHALREEGDASDLHKKRSGWYFYPRPPRGGRPSGFSRTLSLSRFLSTPSARRATSERRHWHIGQSLFLSTPSARRATTGRHPVQHRDRHFYPRPPRGGRPCHQCHLLLYFLFLSTPSARRATRPCRRGGGDAVFLSTPSARRATGSGMAG